MDILLTHGYFLNEDPVERKINRPYPPLGVLYLSAYLKAQGFDPRVYDSTFSDPASLARHISREKPPLVGIYVNMMTRKHVVPLIAACRKAGSRVVLGGPEPANYPKEYFKAGASIIVVGEGEHTLTDLVARLQTDPDGDLSDIPGIQFVRADGAIAVTAPREKIPKLDELPFPDRGAIDMARYMDVWKRHHGASSVSLITARGCPYTCRWCSHAVYGFSYRARSPENVADEIEHIRQTYDPDQVWYADDVFTINKKWIHRYADELEKRGLKLPFETISREDRLDDAVIQRLADMGCYRLWVGAESGSQPILDAMERRTSAVRTREAIAKLQQQGIRAGSFIMFGYTGEGWQDLRETFKHLKTSLPDDLLTTAAYPIKGTAFYEELGDKVIAKSSWSESSDRDLRVEGGKTSLFYWFTTKWMHAGVRLYREIGAKNPRLLSIIRSWVTMVSGRLGMYATWRLSVRR